MKKTRIALAALMMTAAPMCLAQQMGGSRGGMSLQGTFIIAIGVLASVGLVVVIWLLAALLYKKLKSK